MTQHTFTSLVKSIVLEKQGRAHKWCTPMDPPHMAEQKQDVLREHTYSSYARIRDVALNTCQRRWTIGKSGEIGSGISLLATRHDDDDDDDDDDGILFTNLRQKEHNIFIRWFIGSHLGPMFIETSYTFLRKININGAFQVSEHSQQNFLYFSPCPELFLS